jgi:hypothetical protein
MEMHDFEQVAADYIETWNERDAAARLALLSDGWTSDAAYVDPLAEAHGHEQIDAVISSVQASWAGFEFRLVGLVDGHHSQCRFGWELGPADLEAPIAGFDVVQLGLDGRIRSVLGFLDRVPAEPEAVA